MNRFALLALILGAFIIGVAAPASADTACAGFANCPDNSDNSTTVTDNFSPSATAQGGRGGNADSSANAGALAGAGVFGSGNSDNANRNTNLNGAAAGVLGSGNSSSNSGANVGPVGNNSGNSTLNAGFRNDGSVTGIQGQLGILDNDVTNDLTNRQGQGQGQIGINEQGQDQGQDQGQGQGQGQGQTSVGSVDSHDELTVEGDDIVYEAPDIPVNSAAPVFAGACSQGVSVQTQSFGGSAGTTNPVCDYVAVAGGFIAAGDRDDALRVLVKAEDAADWRYRFSQIRSVLTLGLL